MINNNICAGHLFRVGQAALSLLFCLGVPAFGSEPVIGASFESKFDIEAVGGDIFTSTWAADGVLYLIQDDCVLPDGSSANLAVSKLDGEDPRMLTATLVNPMKEYGHANQGFGPDRALWKAAGIISLDNTLYLSINRVLFSSMDMITRRIDTIDASIIKSTDGGKTWMRSMQQNLDHPMFSGSQFSNPIFIQYGKNASAQAHGSDRYVYAVSSDGPWSHGNYLILGRVLRSKIGDLNAADWEFYQGGGRDGMNDDAWTHEVERATPTLNDPEKLGWTNVIYVPQLGRYLMGQWHWGVGRWHCGDCTWIIREAPTPWGPWQVVETKAWDINHDYYFPVITPKFISADGLSVYNFLVGTGGLGIVPMHLRTKLTPAPSSYHLDLRATLGKEQVAAQTIKVSRGDERPVKDLRVESAPPWLVATLNSDARQSQVVNSVNAAGLTPGEYTGEVVLSSHGDEPIQTRYTVALKVQQPHEGLKLGNTMAGLRYQYYMAPTLDSFKDTAQWFNESARLTVTPDKTGICSLPEPYFRGETDAICRLQPTAASLPELYAQGKVDQRLFVHFEGYFVAPNSGEYTFYTKSQESSRLTVAGELVIDARYKYGSPAPDEKSGIVWLEKGLHQFAVDYFHLNGATHLEVDVGIPGQSRRHLEAADMVHDQP